MSNKTEGATLGESAPENNFDSADSTPTDDRDEDRPLYLPLTWSKPAKRERMPRGKRRRNARRAIAARKRGGA